MKILATILMTLFIFSNCQDTLAQDTDVSQIISEKYWNDGLAEVSKYELSQNRYNTVHDGHLMQVFVSEDFLTDKQVKNESYNSKNTTKVLKRIETRHFTTGIYDYNMFTSSFTPFDLKNHPKTIKITSTSQEWCGTTFTQLNSTSKGYNHTINSYFEGEGDKTSIINSAIPEEELFTKIRMNPKLLPLSEFQIIPSSIVSRLLHLKASSFKATATIDDYKEKEFEGKKLKAYNINIPSLNRVVNIVFENTAPFKIVGWIDTYPSMFDKQPRRTVAKLTHQIKEAYWGLNSKKDGVERKRLGLE